MRQPSRPISAASHGTASGGISNAEATTRPNSSPSRGCSSRTSRSVFTGAGGTVPRMTFAQCTPSLRPRATSGSVGMSGAICSVVASASRSSVRASMAKARLTATTGSAGVSMTSAPSTRRALAPISGGAAAYMSSKAAASACSSSATTSSGKEVGQQLAALVGEHRLGVELHALSGQLAVADRHHHAAPAGGDFEDGRQRALLDDQRVVAAHGQRRGAVAEDRPSVVLDGRRLAVHGLAADDVGAEVLRQGLVAQADPERGDAGLGEAPDDLEADAGRVGRARAGRDDDAVGAPLEQLVDRRAVVAHDVDLAAQLAQVLDEVVGERVVVVDDQDTHGQSGCSHASVTASRTARDLATDSSYS